MRVWCVGNIMIIAVVIKAAVTAPPVDEDGPSRRVRPPHSAASADLAPCCLCPLSPTLLLPPAH